MKAELHRYVKCSPSRGGGEGGAWAYQQLEQNTQGKLRAGRRGGHTHTHGTLTAFGLRRNLLREERCQAGSLSSGCDPSLFKHYSQLPRSPPCRGASAGFSLHTHHNCHFSCPPPSTDGWVSLTSHGSKNPQEPLAVAGLPGRLMAPRPQQFSPRKQPSDSSGVPPSQ